MKQILFLLLLFTQFSLLAQEPTTPPCDSIPHIPDSLWVDLPKVYVTGERPLVKVEGTNLIYDGARLIENTPINNVYEALLHVPGISGSENTVSLVGAKSVHIILNGKQSTMTLAQVSALLKSIPASQLKNIEVMSNAPSK